MLLMLLLLLLSVFAQQSTAANVKVGLIQVPWTPVDPVTLVMSNIASLNLLQGDNFTLVVDEIGNCTASVVAGSARRLQMAGVVAIVGAGCSEGSIAASNYLLPYRIPLIDYGGTSPELSSMVNFPYYVRVTYKDAYQLQVFQSLRLRYGWKYFGILAQKDAYGTGAVDYFAQDPYAIISMLPIGSTVEFLQTVMSQLIDQNELRIFLIFDYESLPNLFQAIANVNATTPGFFYFTSAMFESGGITPDEIMQAPLSVSIGLLGSTPYLDTSSRGYKEYMTQYLLAGFSVRTPPPYALEINDAFLTLAYGYGACKTLGIAINGDNLMSALRQVQYEGPSGSLKLQGNDRVLMRQGLLNSLGRNLASVGVAFDNVITFSSEPIWTGSSLSPPTARNLQLGQLVDQNFLFTPEVITTVIRETTTANKQGFIGGGDCLHANVSMIVNAACDTATAIAGARQLIQMGAQIIIGPRCSGSTSAALSVLTPAGIPLLGYSATSPLLNDANAVPLYGSTAAPDSSAVWVALAVLKKLGVMRIAVIARDELWGTGGVAILQQQGKAAGVDVAFVQYLIDTSPLSLYASAVASCINLKIHAYLLLLHTTTLLNFADAAANAGLQSSNTLFLLMSDSVTGANSLNDFIRARPVLYGSLFVTTLIDPQNPSYQTLYNMLGSQRVGTMISSHALHVYDTVKAAMIALQTMRSTESAGAKFDGAEFMRQFKLVNFQGATGTISYNSSVNMPLKSSLVVHSYDPVLQQLVATATTSDLVNLQYLRQFKFGTSTNLPPKSCPRGSIALEVSDPSPLKSVYTCVPCVDGTFATWGDEDRCSNCPSDSVCGFSCSLPLVLSAEWGFQEQFVIPSDQASLLTQDERLSLIYSHILAICIAIAVTIGVSCVAFLPSIPGTKSAKIVREAFRDMDILLDTFHIPDAGQPIIVRSTPIGGLFTILCAITLATAASYIITVDYIDRFEIASNYVLGSLDFKDAGAGDDVIVEILFSGMDRPQNCEAMCLSATNSTLKGNFVCKEQPEISACKITYTPATGLIIPDLSTLTVRYPGVCQVISWRVTTTPYYDQNDDIQTYVVAKSLKANNGSVFHGVVPTTASTSLLPLVLLDQRYPNKYTSQCGYSPFSLNYIAGSQANTSSIFTNGDISFSLDLLRERWMIVYTIGEKQANVWLLMLVEIASVGGATLTVTRLLLRITETLFYYFAKYRRGRVSWWQPHLKISRKLRKQMNKGPCSHRSFYKGSMESRIHELEAKLERQEKLLHLLQGPGGSSSESTEDTFDAKKKVHISPATLSSHKSSKTSQYFPNDNSNNNVNNVPLSTITVDAHFANSMPRSSAKSNSSIFVPPPPPSGGPKGVIFPITSSEKSRNK